MVNMRLKWRLSTL
uniref:Uncharacterized protein n=1 Tax=Anguilla anguilla TaxID=7936 RepID=A0A0E9RZ24_ANGAN